MDMIRRDCVVQYLYTKPFTRLIQPVDVSLTGLSKLQQELLLVTPMRDMPDAARHKITIRSWHDSAPHRSNKNLLLDYKSIFTPKNRPISPL